MLSRCWEMHAGPQDGTEHFPDPVVSPPEHYVFKDERGFATVYHHCGRVEYGLRKREFFIWCPHCSFAGELTHD